MPVFGRDKGARQGGAHLAKLKQAKAFAKLQSLQFTFPAVVRLEAGRCAGQGAEMLNRNGQRTREHERREEMEEMNFHSLSVQTSEL